jgi:hypothetical protein
VQWSTPVILALKKQRQEEQEFKANLVRLYLKKPKGAKKKRGLDILFNLKR